MSFSLRKKINQQVRADRYRQRQLYQAGELIFCDNDYLGLAQDPRVIKALQEGAASYGVGGQASQLVVGYRGVHQTFEQQFAEFLQREAALLFTTGYMANCGVISTLASRNDAIFADKEIHASLIDAIKLSGAQLKRFRHRDYTQLNKQLSTHHTLGKRFVVSDGVFSMRGSLVDLTRCAELARVHQATLIVDDAHGVGVLGKTGGGSCEQLGLSAQQVPVLICPLAKAFGVMGAIVAGSRTLIDGLIQFARSYTYTTAIPPAFAVAGLTSLSIVRQESWRREKLNDLIQHFKACAAQTELNLLPSHTPIQRIQVGEARLALSLSEKLRQQGMVVSAMRPPTVGSKESCLRIIITVKHNKRELSQLVNALESAYAALS